MTTEIATMLDELMGKNRNAAPDDQKNDMHWSDKDVCKHFLCGFCPAELFTNTRSDLGPCEKVHDESLRKAYLKSTRYLKMSYESDFLHYLQQCMQDVERRIRRNHQRLQLSEEKNQKLANPSKDVEEQINLLTKRIEEMLQKIELLGTEGKVEEAQGVMKLCDQLKEDREQLYGQKGNVLDAFSVQEKQMEVCEVCGAFLIVGDAQSRVDDHLMGKQHMGYAKIKATIEELKEKLMSKPAAKDDKDEGSEKKNTRSRTDEGRRSRDSGRLNRSNNDKDRSRHRSRSRDRDRRSRQDDRRDRDRRRSRDKERRGSKDRRYSRDNDRHRSRDHDRSRRRSRERDSRRSGDSRSKEDRSKRSRSRDKDRKHSRKHSRPRSISQDKNPKRSRKGDQQEGEGSSAEDKKTEKSAHSEQDQVTESNEQVQATCKENEEPKETQVTENENENYPTSDGYEVNQNDSSEIPEQAPDTPGPPGDDGDASTNTTDNA